MYEIEVSREQQAAQLHKRIISNGTILAQALVEVCCDLKTMRDEELYKELNYSSFEEYAENACGIKQRQAYSYIAAYERLGEKYLEQNAELGITKLELISQIQSYEREDFLSETNVEEISTRELKEKVAEYKKQNEQLKLDLDSLKEQSDEEITELKEKLSAEQQKAQEVIIAKNAPSDEEIDAAVEKALKEERQTVKTLKEKLKTEKAKLKTSESNIEERIKRAKEEVLTEANDRIDKLVEESKLKDTQLKEALKNAKVAGADENTISVRLLFNNLQSTAINISNQLEEIARTDEEKADKLRKVITEKVIELLKD